jgi:hypothetical protein
MFAEAIPGVIIQLSAIAESTSTASFAAWFSIIVSAASTGFTSATISYDWDTDPQKRQQVPDFYGYVPANPTRRSLVFALMMLSSAGLLLVRCMTISLLGVLGRSWALAYVAADIIMFFLVKIVQGDIWYWAPLKGKAEVLLTFLMRLTTKPISDFTSVLQLRHPNEVGGQYWAFSLFLTMASLPMAMHIFKSQGGKGEAERLGWIFITYLIPCVAGVYILFFATIEGKYLNTFFGGLKGRELTVKNFREATNDENKALFSLQRSRHHWSTIEEEVRSWVESSWERWEEDKPKWFNETMKSRVPVEFIPTAGGRRRESERRKPKYLESEKEKQTSKVKGSLAYVSGKAE